MSSAPPDFQRSIRDFLKLVFAQLSGLVTSGMICVKDPACAS